MSSFDQVIKNILADIFAEEEQQEVTRPRARPEGLMSSTRPRARPEDVEPVQPSASESTSKFVAAMSDYDDTPEEGVEIPLAFFKGTARDLEGRYKTTGMQLAKLNKNRGDSNIRVAAVEEDTTVDDLIAELEMSMKPMLRPRARPKSAEEIQTIRAEQASYTKLDSVRDIQQALNAAGIEVNGKPLVVDGIKGRNTLAAIKAFQKREGLKVDGIVGKNTKAALIKGVEPAPEIDVEELPDEAVDTVVEEGTPEVVKAGLFSMPKLGLVTSTPAKLLIKNVLGLDKNQYLGLKPITIDEASFKEDELAHFKNMWNKHGKPEGGYITKEQHMAGQKDILQIATGQDGSPLNLNAAQRAYYSVGDTYMYEDDEGNVILKDMYDYNLYTDYSGEPDSKGKYPILSTEQFEEKYSTAGGLASTASAFATGKIGFMSALHNIGFLLGSRDYKDSSKDEGTPILINLGNPDTWS